MRSGMNHTLVGAFVLLLGGLFVAVVLWLTVGLEKRQFDYYVVYSEESVAGLNLRAPVRYRGVEIGRVGSIALDPDDPRRVRLVLEVFAGTPLRADTEAVLTTQGLTGLASLELSGGTPEAPVLPQRRSEPYPELVAGPSLIARLDRAVGAVVDDVARLSERLERLLDDENLANLAATLEHLGRFSAHLATHGEQVGDVVAQAHDAFVLAARAAQGLERTLHRIDQAAAGVEQAGTALARNSETVGTVLVQSATELRLRGNETAVGLEVGLEEVRRLALRLERLAESLEREPQRLLFGAPQPAPGPGE